MSSLLYSDTMLFHVLLLLVLSKRTVPLF